MNSIDIIYGVCQYDFIEIDNKKYLRNNWVYLLELPREVYKNTQISSCS